MLQTDEDTKKIFNTDISARIPYRLHCCVYNFDREVWVEDDILYDYDLGGNCQTLKILNECDACLMYYQIRPYLRTMSSMTEDEKEEYDDLRQKYYKDAKNAATDLIDWFNEHHFDHRGLIEKCLALEAPEGMYNTKTK